MKRWISLFLISILIMGVLSACGKALEVDRNTVYVQKKGKIVGATIEKFDKDYYDAKELESYVNERVDKYLAEHDSKSIKVDKFSVEKDLARLNIAYAGYEDYAAFNGVELFEGTLPEAMAAGYTFEDTFTKIEKGAAKGEADKAEVTAEDGYKVVVLDEKVNVKVDGTILYVSSANTTVTAKDTVEIKLSEDAKDGEELSITYIIYK